VEVAFRLLLAVPMVFIAVFGALRLFLNSPPGALGLLLV
jgi:hypothetical protein